MTSYTPIPRWPVSKALAALWAPILPVGHSSLPVDDDGTVLGPPYAVLDPAGHTYNGPAYGDRHGQADWSYMLRLGLERGDQAQVYADKILGRFLARTDGVWDYPLTVPGQWEQDRSVDPGGYQPVPSADGIVGLVLRLTVRTQRAN